MSTEERDNEQDRDVEQDSELVPVLADEQVVGTHLIRRFRIMLVFIAVTLVLTNVTAYLVGLSFAADSDRRTVRRVAALEKALGEDLNQRRARRDAEFTQLRRDACVLADRIGPQDAEVQEMRRRYGCTGMVSPSVSPSGTSRGGRVVPSAGGPVMPAPSPQRPPRLPAPPDPPPVQPPPVQPPPPQPAPDEPLLCLPIIGCIL